MAKILIIDDEEQLRRLMARIIGLEGYEVAEAPDCASGMKTLRRYDPDVVLCDVKLPDGNGVEMVGRIKEAAPATEVILLTAYGNIPDGVQALESPFSKIFHTAIPPPAALFDFQSSLLLFLNGFSY